VGWFVFGENHRIIRSMTHELSNPSFHPAGEQPPVEGKGPPQGVILDSFSGPGACRMGYRGGADAAWAIAVLHRFSESGWPVRRFRGGLPAALHEPERAEKTRCVGNGDAVDVVWAQALCSHSGVTLR